MCLLRLPPIIGEKSPREKSLGYVLTELVARWEQMAGTQLGVLYVFPLRCAVLHYELVKEMLCVVVR